MVKFNKAYDLSHFHPMTHRIGSRACRAAPGGPRRHFIIWYNFRFQWPWAAAYHWTRCQLRLHEWIDIHEGAADGPVTERECVWCPAKAYTRTEEVTP